MAWVISGDKPIYLQLMEQMKLRIISGQYAPGQRIPSVRELASQAAVNPNTMQKALVGLEEQRLLYSQRTAGRFITQDTALIQQAKEAFALEQINEFIHTMTAMGFQQSETVQLLKRVLEEEWNE